MSASPPPITISPPTPATQFMSTEVFLMLGGLSLLVVAMGLFFAWILHRLVPDAQLHTRALIAGTAPAIVYFILIVGLTVMIDGQSLFLAVSNVFRMSARGYAMFAIWLALGYISALVGSRMLARRKARRHPVDPETFA